MNNSPIPLGSIFVCLLAVLVLCPNGWAKDSYVGDTAIYGGEISNVKPNVLIIMDSSGSMDYEIPGAPYASEGTYPDSGTCGQSAAQSCQADTVYESRTGFTWVFRYGRWFRQSYDYWHPLTSLQNVTTSCGGMNPRASLENSGKWTHARRQLTSDGRCARGGGTYQTGHYINWSQSDGEATPKVDIAREVLKDLVKNTGGVNFGIMRFNYKGRTSWYHGGEFIAKNVDGKSYITTIKDMDEDHTSGKTNREALEETIDLFTTEWAIGGTPLSETMLEATRYFQGEPSLFADRYEPSYARDFTSPILAHCQYNYVILLSDGMSSVDMAINDYPAIGDWFEAACGGDGDCDGDGYEPQGDSTKNYTSGGHDGSDYLDDVAHYLAHNDQRPDLEGDQTVKVFTVGFGLDDAAIDAGAVRLLQETADNGKGEFFSAEDAGSLSDALTGILSDIIEVNHSFVAPVVPASPSNRSYSGERVYVGLFKPSSEGVWTGNLKKYSLTSEGVMDQNGTRATDEDGKFLETSRSYWSIDVDGSEVEKGGVGQKLQAREASSRLIFTNATRVCDDDNISLTCDENQVTVDNTKLTNADFAVETDVERAEIIDYLHGLDSYDDDADGNKAESRQWVMGSVLHAQPVVVSYQAYAFSEDAEKDTTKNKAVIFVPANDGMLHAFWDATGEEIWGFIPKPLLADVKGFGDGVADYGLDATPLLVSIDHDRDGNIGPYERVDGDADTGDNDLVLLVFGMRRGGSHYYALNVTDPQDPKLLWDIGPDDAAFAQLGQSWSTPTVGKVKYKNEANGNAAETWLTLFFGQGYDNQKEDRRYGATQLFEDAATGAASVNDVGNTTSDGETPAIDLTTARGRGVVAVALAKQSADKKSWEYSYYENHPPLLWSAQFATDTNVPENKIRYSVVGAVTPVDTDYDGYTDRLYWADTGGQVWRSAQHKTSDVDGQKLTLPASSPVINLWSSERIFTAGDNLSEGSVSADSEGRKFFFRPSVVPEKGGLFSLYLGSGDRPHPLNTAVTDRFYCVVDRGQQTSDLIQENRLVDVTSNSLQSSSISEEDRTTLLRALELFQKGDNEKYGWYIRLNQRPGEKTLSAPTVFNKVAYFSTFTAETSSTDDCAAGNLGEGRLYAVDYRTGEAVFNYDTNNDDDATDDNERARGSDGVLRRSDRSLSLGEGIPPTVTILLPKGDPAQAVVGTGGGLRLTEVTSGGRNSTLYWLQR